MNKVELKKGDITRMEVDAIVNAANNYLFMGAGLAGAIKRAGGQEIEEEAVAKGPVPVGHAVATGAGKLKARYVIHAAVMGTDLVTDAEKIRMATRESLKCARDLGVKTLAFPALGTGVGGFSFEDCARIMIEEIFNFLKQDRGIEKVFLVLFDEAAYYIFREQLALVERKLI